MTLLDQSISATAVRYVEPTSGPDAFEHLHLNRAGRSSRPTGIVRDRVTHGANAAEDRSKHENQAGEAA
jgi:hypothetical protein